MGKPKIVVADLDENYIVPLQQKFIEVFFDKIDLEIVTTPEYFQALFSSPQKMDILIVSEDFYSLGLQRHNIENLFLMTEQPFDGQTNDLMVTRIFKYAKNVKEIFNEIIASASDTLKLNEKIKKQTQTVLVTSAGGGDGKTTVALGVASCLSQAHKRVLYIDAEFVQNFQYFLRSAAFMPDQLLSDFKAGNEQLYENIRGCILKELFEYLPPFRTAISSYNISFGVFPYLIEQIKQTNHYDFIVIDTDSVFSDEKGDLIDASDKVFVITRQNAYAVFKTNCMLKNINYSDTEKFMFLCNAFRADSDNALLDRKSQALFMANEYIHWIPECEKMRPDELAKIDGLQKIAYALL